MKTAFFDSHKYEREAFESENRDFGHEIAFFEFPLNATSVELAKGYSAVCAFVNDDLSADVLRVLKRSGTAIVALRCAGFNNVDLTAAAALGIPIVRVEEYSPHAVAEHAVALMLTLNRKIHRAYTRVRELNFSLDGLVGFDMSGKTVGVVGTGRIGRALVKILNGFGCRVLAHDLEPDRRLESCGAATYVSFESLCRQSDVISLHVPLTPATRHIVDARALSWMKPAALLINTGRGALVETKELIGALKHRRLGGAGLDVYEEEEGVFFQDLSSKGIEDDWLARLLTFPNVVITSHQGFLTVEALSNIARATLTSLSDFEAGKPLAHRIQGTP